MAESEQHVPTSEWWARRRLRYNVSLACAGIIAFVCYAAVVFAFEDVIPDADINALTIMFQGCGYLLVMGLANICFYVGPMSERICRPKRVERFRTVTYRLGYWFSMLLPFTVPALLLYFVLFEPDAWTQ